MCTNPLEGERRLRSTLRSRLRTSRVSACCQKNHRFKIRARARGKRDKGCQRSRRRLIQNKKKKSEEKTSDGGDCGGGGLLHTKITSSRKKERTSVPRRLL